MKRLKEKLKAIYHVITDSEYIIFTATVRDCKVKRCCALISDNSSDMFIKSAIEILNERN